MELTAATVREFGAALRRARTEAGLTQQELAERANVSRRWIRAVENGDRPGAELALILTTLAVLDRRLTLSRRPAPDSVTQDLLALLDAEAGQ
jgi:transcriptional regulator with XRE-family HTH domain